MASRKLADLHPLVQPLARAFQLNCESEQLDVIITCTWRPSAEQAQLYAQGRDRPGRIVTWARPGLSFHEYQLLGNPASLAFDVVPLRYGKTVWGTAGDGIDTDPTDDDTDDLELWERVGVAGEKAGLAWAGRWPKGKREFPHLEHPQAAMVRARGE